MKTCSKFLMSIMLLFGIIAINSSCKKTDSLSDNNTATDSEITRQFFNLSPTEHPLVKRIAAELQKRNNTSHFVADFAKTNGFAIWDKAILAPKPKTVLQRDGDEFEVADTLIYVPLVLQDSLQVNGSILAKVKGDSIFFKYVLAQDYKAYPFSSTQQSKLPIANEFATFMFVLNREVFGHTTFTITDERLFADPSYPDVDTTTKTVSFDTSHIDNLNIPSRACEYFQVRVCGSNGGLRTSNLTTTGNCYTFIQEWCYDVYDDPGGWGGSSGGTSGGPVGGGIPGGGGGGTGGIPHDYPCQTTNTCTPPGGGIGWWPIPVEPYVCTYQMTQADIDIFNQIDAEDSIANHTYQNLDCKGTKRGGNINFPGTKEHLLLQLDYAMKNPTYGEIEFAIPHSSPTGNRGYADIVNLQDGSIFEIKPTSQLSAGINEVNRYVLNADLHCNSTLPMGTAWHKGQSYANTYLPTNTAGTYLVAQLTTPGVITYEYQQNINPIPLPTVVPQSVIDKFRHLIDRLRDNLSQVDAVISEYLRQNPDLATYIKGAAIGAGVAIIVGTIVEDFLTLGGGIWDDILCFKLAWRIIRFGIAM